MAKEIPILKLPPQLLQSIGVEGEAVALYEIKLFFNAYTERFQRYYSELPENEKAKLSVYQRRVLEEFRPRDIWFTRLSPSDEFFSEDRIRAEAFIKFFSSVVEALEKKTHG